MVNIIVSRDHQDPEAKGVPIVLNLFEGWEDLDDDQQKYLHLYAKNSGFKSIAAMDAGYPMSTVNAWFNNATFLKVADNIYEYLTDVLKERDMFESVFEPKIRNRVIQSREKKGRYSPETKSPTHNHLHIEGGASLSKMLQNFK